MSRDTNPILVRDVTPDLLEAYLTTNEWTYDGDLHNLASIWHRSEPEHHDAEILLPRTADLKDYIDRMADAVLVIAAFEEVEPAAVVKAVIGHFTDQVRIRVIHTDVAAGTIPLKDGVLLNQHARDLMAAAAMSTGSKRRHFTSKPSPVAKAFLESLRLGQTEEGSYVVNIIAPLDKNQGNQLGLPAVPLGNVVTDNLSLGLFVLNDALEWYGRTLDRTIFDNAVLSGASANMCDALIGLSGLEKNREVEITVAPAGSQRTTRTTRTFLFDGKKIEHLGIASAYYKDNYVAENQTVVGTIQRLDRPVDQDRGTITIEAKIRDAEKHIAIELAPDDYEKAITAHQQKEDVQCTGDLYVSPRKATLLSPRGFRVLASRNLFDDQAKPS
ncbi:MULTISPECIES: hypothetical protein [Paraburkholderia]|uniref:hypothetical protein n=1 Tax=Paraburkholderia TaxID=1822464 RepID=UPI000477C8C2|nr:MULTISPECIES: hypothetical protein [Paraburkholderia]MDH6152622.1 hypothetical protein [Paraburkholderia sp. WSM4179]